MTPERYERVRRIFLGVRELTEPHRSAFLEKACRDDPSLRTDVEAFLSDQDRTASFIDTPALGENFGLGRQHTLHTIDRMPEQIGRYQIIEVLGRGGMGVVYLAKHPDTGVHVALKVMRPDMVSPEIMRRFDHEGRILAMLKHHGMAQIHEVATFDAGFGAQPFMVMEYVRGVPLLEYATNEQLSINDRLTLMIKICSAIQYSHHKGVIHRDIKPSNILVDQSGQPKIVDFGIARITDADIRTTQAATEAGQVIGTVPYMSPEQCDPDPAALDTRSDVYSLGVVCYELLTGHLPYDLGDSILQSVRAITSVAPTPMHSYNAFINEDLDRIVMRALEKDKEQRIQSAGDLSEDIGRVLRGESPLTVQPEPRPSRLSGTLRRHRRLVGLFVAFVLVGVGGAAGLVLTPIISPPPQPVPLPSAEGEIYESINGLVAQLVATVAASGDEHSIAALAAALDATASDLDAEPPDPSLEIRLRRTIASGYGALDRWTDAWRQLGRGYDLSVRRFGAQDVRTLEVRAELEALRARNRRSAPAAGPPSDS